MVKVYCDRCNKELNTNDPHYYPLGDAANGDDIFFTISRYTKFEKRPFNTNNRRVKPVGDAPADIRYDYTSPDLCPECMRVISDAVKTVWDGKNKVMVREIYGAWESAAKEQNS